MDWHTKSQAIDSMAVAPYHTNPYHTDPSRMGQFTDLLDDDGFDTEAEAEDPCSGL
jgi:hypothetical protein